MNLIIEYEQEESGRWLAEVPELPGVLVYGAAAEDSMAKAEILALRVLAERIKDSGQPIPKTIIPSRKATRDYPSESDSNE